VSVKANVVVHGEVYVVLPCPRREIVRAWRETGGGLAALVEALAHPGERFVWVGDEPPDGAAREPRRPRPVAPASGIALDPPQDWELERPASAAA
jgi:hypothetical protein